MISVTLEAISFDLFNTLVGIKPVEQHLLTHVLDRYLSQMGFSNHSSAIIEYYRKQLQHLFSDRQQTYREFNNAELLQNTIKTVTNNDIPIQECKEIINSYFKSVKTFVFEEVPNVLENLAGRYHLYLVSNHSWPEAARKAVNPIKRYFRKIIISGDVGWRKPSEIIFRPIIEQHGKNVVHCGDHGQEDIDAVYPLGWKAIWIKRNENCPQPTIYKHIISIVKNLKELPTIIP